MSPRKVILIAIKTLALGFLFGVPSVLANCSDRIASLELVQPVMERLWPRLKAENPIYGQIKDDSITLTEEFDRLSGLEKKQLLEQLKLGYNPDSALQKVALNTTSLGLIIKYNCLSS